MNELKTVSALVKNILIESEQARNSDNVLYLLVLKFYAERKGVNLNCVNVCDFLSYLDHKVFPAFETVRRSRQKVQEVYPELAATENVGRRRASKQQEYRNFANGTL